jgi:hypothetical protein
MSKNYWVLSMVCVCLVRLAPAQAGATPTTIGIALPQGQLGQGAEVAEPLRQSLINQLKAQSVAAVPLAASAGGPVDAEAVAKHCTYVLYIRVEQKHSMGGMLGKLAPLAGALPFGALSGRGVSGMMTNAALQGAANAAEKSAATSVQEQAVSQLTGAAQSGVKRGDTVALDYRLLAVGSANPIKSETFSSKAAGDGQDVVSPLVGQLAGAVVRVAQAAPVAQGTPSTENTAPGDSSDTRSSNEHSSLLGGLWGHKSASSSKPAGGAAGGGMDCAKLAGMPNAPMSLESCQKLQSAQQAYSQAASDPGALRPVAQRQMGQMAGFGADFAEQFKSNPRLARLMQLADTKHCKGGG